MNTKTKRWSLFAATISLLAAFFVISNPATVSAWHAESACVDKQWVLTGPTENWSTDTVFTYTFDDDTVLTGTAGESVTAPEEAKSVVVTYSDSYEEDTYKRPNDCKPVKAVVGATADCDNVTVTSTKGISNVVVDFSDAADYKYDGLSGLSFSFPYADNVVGVWIKSGNNSSGDGPGYGEYVPITAPQDCDETPEYTVTIVLECIVNDGSVFDGTQRAKVTSNFDGFLTVDVVDSDGKVVASVSIDGAKTVETFIPTDKPVKLVPSDDSWTNTNSDYAQPSSELCDPVPEPTINLSGCVNFTDGYVEWKLSISGAEGMEVTGEVHWATSDDLESDSTAIEGVLQEGVIPIGEVPPLDGRNWFLLANVVFDGELEQFILVPLPECEEEPEPVCPEDTDSAGTPIADLTDVNNDGEVNEEDCNKPDEVTTTTSTTVPEEETTTTTTVPASSTTTTTVPASSTTTTTVAANTTTTTVKPTGSIPATGNTNGGGSNSTMPLVLIAAGFMVIATTIGHRLRGVKIKS